MTVIAAGEGSMHEPDDHDHGLAHDLGIMNRMIERRRALQWLGGAGTAALIAGCGRDGSASESTSSVGVVSAGATATPTPIPSATATATTSGACIVDPAETAGPYPADGTNTSSGSTSNVLPINGIVRSDIRSSFISTTTVATGLQLTVTLTLVDVNASCGALAGYAIYLWHCDRLGNYSLYSVPAESYLRGVQVTNGSGQVTFTTIFPACYSGRWPHIHFEIYSSLSAATSGKYALLTSQLCMPTDVCNAVFADTTTYPSSKTQFAQVSMSSDLVFGDNSAAQIAQQTPTFGGSVAAGYTATALIGIAR